MQRDGKTWGDGNSPNLAHADERMTCATCHSSWITSCFGCHLSQTANQKRHALHNEIEHDAQLDVVQLPGAARRRLHARQGRHGDRRPHLAGALVERGRRELAGPQPAVGLLPAADGVGGGLCGQAFNTHVPHTVRTAETKTCTDCHVSANGDNNAWMAQLLLLGTNFVNFMGRFVYVATGHGGVEAVAVTEMDEPQAVIGSDLHRLAYPASMLPSSTQRPRADDERRHHGSSNALSMQARGEYLYIADGEGGFRVFDIAQLNQKGFSEKIVTAPVSPFGQNTNVEDALRNGGGRAHRRWPSTRRRSRLPENEEQPIHPIVCATSTSPIGKKAW